MHHVAPYLLHLLNTYGYWAVLLFVGVESTGIPFPGEAMLLAAAIYAGTTHHLHIALVIAAAAAGVILGDNLGFGIGREGGFRLVRRYGPAIRLDERKLKLEQYLFLKHGGKVVFFGRFVAVLRTWAAFLAGTNRMSCASPRSPSWRSWWSPRSPSWRSSSTCGATSSGWRTKWKAPCPARSTRTDGGPGTTGTMGTMSMGRARRRASGRGDTQRRRRGERTSHA
jgi:membrane protein YqaA with SNARE-associated domain